MFYYKYGGCIVCEIFITFHRHDVFQTFCKTLHHYFLVFHPNSNNGTSVTLTKTFDLKCIQYIWNPNDNYGWMSDTMGGKFNFYYRVGDMVTNGILDAGRKKVPDDIMTHLQTWYIKQIHDRVTAAGIADSTING